MEIKYELFEKEQLLIQKFFGLFSPEFYTRNIGRIFSNLNQIEINKVLIDFREIRIHDKEDTVPFDFSDRLDKIIQFRTEINQNELDNKDVVLVFWVDKPLPTVIADIFIRNFSGKNYHYCSSEERIYEILRLNSDFNLSAKISNLREKL